MLSVPLRRGYVDRKTRFLRHNCSVMLLVSVCYLTTCGPSSVVGIATAYGLDGPGIESRWGEIFRTSPGRP